MSGDDHGGDPSPSWGVAVLFVFFLLISLVWEKGLHTLEHFFERRKLRGLMAILKNMKDELLVFGVLSLLMTFAQTGLSRICIPGTVPHSDTHAIAAAGGLHDHSPAALPISHPAAGDAPAHHNAAAVSDHHTTLQEEAAAGRRLLSDADIAGAHPKPGACPSGYRKLYSIGTIHDTHLLIVIVSLTHICYAALLQLLCLFRVRSWARWEEAGKQLVVRRISGRVVNSIGRNPVVHYIWCFCNQYLISVNENIFLGVRRLFVEQLRIHTGTQQPPADFPYHSFLVEQLERNLAEVTRLESLVWALAVVVVGIPDAQRPIALFAIAGFAAVTLMICGTKLNSIMVHLAARAHFLFGRDAIAAEVDQIISTASIDLVVDDGAANTKDATGNGTRPAVEVSADTSGSGGGSSCDGGATAAGAVASSEAASPAALAARRAAFGRGRLQMAGGGSSSFGSQGVMSTLSSRFSVANRLFSRGSRTLRRHRGIGQKHVGLKHRVGGDLDAGKLFWGGNPKWMLLLYKMSYFSVAFCLSVLFFSYWRRALLPQTGALFGLLAVIAAASLQNAWTALPVYALALTTSPSVVKESAAFLKRRQQLAAEAEQQVTACEAAARERVVGRQAVSRWRAVQANNNSIGNHDSGNDSPVAGAGAGAGAAAVALAAAASRTRGSAGGGGGSTGAAP